MEWLSHKRTWYAGGLAFECLACGRCCAGPEEGYVWVTAQEIQRIAESLRMPEPEFRRRYIRREGTRYTIVEQPGNNDCSFLKPDGSGAKRCSIYAVRQIGRAHV